MSTVRLSCNDLVGRFICSVTYFLSCFICRTVELVQHSIEISSGEAPLEGFGDTFVMSLERERSEEHTSELQSQSNLVCRLLLEKKKRLDSSRSDLGPLRR